VGAENRLRREEAGTGMIPRPRLRTAACTARDRPRRPALRAPTRWP
jgi:hypothetical protein